MSEVEKDFQLAQEYIQKAPNQPGSDDNERKLKFYALFRQAKDGKVTGKRPGVFDIVARYKYDYWAKLGDMSKEQAMKEYIALLEQNSPKWREFFKDDQQRSKL